MLDRLGKDYNPDEPRIPAGNGRESGEWTIDYVPGVFGAEDDGANGGAHDYGSGITPVADRQTADEYRTGNFDEFFETLYGPVHALAQRLGIEELGSLAWPRLKAAGSTRTIATSTTRSA